MAASTRSCSNTSFRLAVLVSLVLVGAIVVLDWPAQNALFVYWVEIGLSIPLYSVLVLFAKRKPQPNERTIDPLTIPVPFVSRRSGSTRLARWLPPLHWRNGRYAVGLLLGGLVVWSCLATLFVYLPAPDPIRLRPDRSGIPLAQALSLVSDAYSHWAVGGGIVLFCGHFWAIHQWFFARRQYTSLSAPMISEMLFRQLAFWFAVTAFAGLVFPIVSLPLVAVVDTRAITEFGLTALAVGGKLTVEWGTLQVRRDETVTKLARWFAPEEIT